MLFCGTIFPLGARIESSASALEQLGRFAAALVDRRIDSTDCVVWGAVLLGITCGVLGAFVVLRRQSLMGDAIGHSVLPGVCLGFLVAGQRDLPMLLGGAAVAGLLAALLIAALQRTTRLKPGECMGVAFTGFYGLGIVVYKHLMSAGHAGQAGLEKFLFGQIAGTSLTDVLWIGGIAAMSLAIVLVAWRPLAITSFDEQYATSIGIPLRLMNNLLLALLTVAIVVAIQAAGVVLVSALLITPAAAAYLLTDRLHRMVLLSGLFGALTGVAGATSSMLVSDAPTGAFIVLAASSVFAVAFVLSPRHGVLPRLLRIRQRRLRTQAENLLRSAYLLIERQHPQQPDATLKLPAIADLRGETVGLVRRIAQLAHQRGWIAFTADDALALTAAGHAEARRLVRNHRLWELFLTQEAHLAPDHAHMDAEYIEHVLPRDVLRRLEAMLDHPAADPHGAPIPRENGADLAPGRSV